MSVHQVYFSLGSNLGNREELLREAIELISERVGPVIRQSSLIETEPWGFESDHQFLNGAILCETERSPREVLRLTQKIERDLGRRKNVNCDSLNRIYKDRPIDIDILLYDDCHIDEPDLKIPHPLMHERDFVMIPLNEILK